MKYGLVLARASDGRLFDAPRTIRDVVHESTARRSGSLFTPAASELRERSLGLRSPIVPSAAVPHRFERDTATSSDDVGLLTSVRIEVTVYERLV